MKITKAVIPAGGHGTRFLPWTKAVPKEMIPLFNKPAIHYIAQEIVDSGISECILVTAPYKQAIANYFGRSPELELFLKEKNKTNLIADIQKLSQQLRFTSIFQDHAKGLGDAVKQAEHTVGQDYFSVLLPDDIVMGDQPAIAQLMAVAQQENASVIAVQEIPTAAISLYGVVAIKKQISDRLFEISGLVEKPAAKDAPSNLAIIGRYILSPKIFKALGEISPSIGGEIQLTDGIAQMLAHGQKVYAYNIKGVRHDVGTPEGWLQTIITLALQDPRYASIVKNQ